MQYTNGSSSLKEIWQHYKVQCIHKWTSVSIINGKIDLDLYKKETDRKQYLLRESCHPKGVTAAIPFSLGLRIVRICTTEQNRDLRLLELKNVLTERNYPEELINRGIEKARKIPRKIALFKVA